MNIFIEEHQELLRCLVHNKVMFLLIGGYAVIHYGYGRTTGDMDIWLQLGDGNKGKLLKALKDFGIDNESIEQLRELDLIAPYRYFILVRNPGL